MTTTAKVGITGIDASYYLTKDLGESTEFYTSLFGFAPSMHFAPVSEWTFDGGETFGLYQPDDAKDWRKSGGILFHVADIKGSVDAAKTLGAKIEGQEETPMCFMAFGEDPEGNGFILHQKK